ATRLYTITEPAIIDSTVSLAGGTLTANQAGATYQWFECPNTIVPGETNQSFTPAVSGTYRATITMGTCSADSGCQPVLGTPSFEANQKFVIYPNPNSGVVNIKSDFDGDFQIVNQLGQTVKTFKIMMNTVNTINLDNLSDGIYFVRGANQTKISTQRLIIKK
ncbi:MAG: T9SS type A sorting domain-containing protein, partial [Flavobacterium sp.]